MPSIEKANRAENKTGDIDFVIELVVNEIPFSSPRRSGPVALLMANETPM